MASIFSGKAGRDASVYQSQMLGLGKKEAYDYLDQGRNTATGYINRNNDIYNDAFNKASGLIGAAYDRADGAIQSSKNQWQPFYDTGVQANNAYADAMGLNGAEGRARAAQSFQAGPGYEFARSQGLDAIQRSAAARGGLASGNTSVDLMKYANGLASQTYDNWLNQFNPLMQNGMQAAQGRAQSDQLAAQYAANRGETLAGMQTSLGDRLAGTNISLADIESALAGNKANLAYQAAQGIGAAGAEGLKAGQQAAQNRFDAAKTAASTLLDIFKAYNQVPGTGKSA